LAAIVNEANEGLGDSQLRSVIDERDDEVLALIDDLLTSTATANGPTDILTIGQYLQPTRNHLPLDRFVHPDVFAMYKVEGMARGLKVVESGPMVRSSYHADHQADELTDIIYLRR